MWLLKLRCGEFRKKIEKNPQGSACVYFLSFFVLNIFAKPPKKVDLCECPPARCVSSKSGQRPPVQGSHRGGAFKKGHAAVLLAGQSVNSVKATFFGVLSVPGSFSDSLGRLFPDFRQASEKIPNAKCFGQHL